MDVLAPHCIVEIATRRFDSWREADDVHETSVQLTTDKTGEGIVSLFDPDFRVIDSLTGTDGISQQTARFWFGWGSSLGDSLFVGSLARVEHSNGISTFRFHDYSAKMKQAKKARYHKKKTDLQILQDLATENGLKFQAPKTLPPSEKIDDIIQTGKTDWDFALKIAGHAGLKLYVRGATLFAVEAGTTALADSVATLDYGTDFQLLRGFNLTYKLPENKKGRPRKTEVRGRASGGKLLKGSQETGTRGVTDIVVNQDLPKQTIALAERRAGGKNSRRREYAFEHHLETLPSFRQRIEVRDTIALSNMGKFFSGKYVVTEVQYGFHPGNLTCEFSVGRDLK